MDRQIGSYGEGNDGALVIAFGAVHGNEQAGVQALERVFSLLNDRSRVERKNPFRGRLIGLLGNRQAYAAGVRFLEKDLNRLWTLDQLQRIRHTPQEALHGEDLEMLALFEAVHDAIAEIKPDTLVLLDLHTTSADGGVFCIPTDDKASLRLAKALHAPVILDLFEGVGGTLLRFGTDGHFQISGLPRQTIGAAFEAGRHEDPLSVNRSVAAILNCLRAAGCIEPDALIGGDDAILDRFSASLPKVTRLRHVHHIRPGDAFRMRPGYLNFQPVQKGEYLADDATGRVLSPQDGLILMPLYQAKGSDGFFIVEPYN
ncbi:MAG: succinylglutamate desuccinylase/aspartoacylase family protein [Saprospiraceae bacterium]|nr:succinylglutamate desuccinylase/aspartoacylase family protein [Saprospiraceae bacterium]